MNIYFPDETARESGRRHIRYWNTYYKFPLDLFRYTGNTIELGDDPFVGGGRFRTLMDDREVIIDFSDLLELDTGFEQYAPYFKFHYSEGVHEHLPNLFPFTPISFYNWDQYFELEKQITYTAQGHHILNRQKAHGNARFRRRRVQDLLSTKHGHRAQFAELKQENFWLEIPYGLVAVCVPGYRDDILDRGQWQYMAFGMCTISPKINTMLPGFQKLIPGVHYLQCARDFSDLNHVISWAQNNREACLKIGNQAKQLFMTTGTPQCVTDWVQHVLAGKAADWAPKVVPQTPIKVTATPPPAPKPTPPPAPVPAPTREPEPQPTASNSDRSDYKLLIKFPTRERPEKFLTVLDRYLAMLHDKENYEVLISADDNDTTMNNGRIKAEVARRKNCRICFSPNKTKIEAVNADMQPVPDFDIVLLASDDMTPVVQGYDKVIRDNFRRYYPDTDGALFFNDGHTRQKLNTLCILGRKYYDRFGYIYHPAYVSFYCDNEYTEVGQMLNRIQYFPQVIIRHDHYTFTRNGPDPLYKRNGRFMRIDQHTYNERKARNFELNLT